MDDGWRGLTLTNTLTRAKEEFHPRDWRDGTIPPADKRVRMYVCGPTVYDFAHIGNARPVIVFDVLFRLLRHLYPPNERGEERVIYVRNITDVDDKINARAAQDHPGLPLNEAIRKVTEATAAQFRKDAAALGCLPPTHEPRATEFVGARADGKPDMVSMIATLIEKGHAYEAGGDVLFDVNSMPDYGRLSNRRLDEQQAGARVAVDAHKRNPGDFVLWKLSDENEPGWEAPFGQEAWEAAGRAGQAKGRPGWHIECSVMAKAYLGPVFDIHGGGLDLIFPHHENEIAQSRCAHGTDKMAEVWMHNGFLQLEGKKMSKSDGNFVTISELMETANFGGRKWPGEVLRLAMLMTHYREPIDFSVKRLEEAEAIREKWYVAKTKLNRPLGVDQNGRIELSSATMYPFPEHPPTEEVLAILLDDLNTPRAVGAIHDLLRRFNEGDIRAGQAMLANASAIGIELNDFETGDEFAAALDFPIEQLIETRLERLRAKDFAKADRIREELLGIGIQLKDGKDPVTGERVTTWEVKR